MKGKHTKRKQPVEYSKVSYSLIIALTAVVVVFTLIMVWRTNDLSPLGYLIPAVFAELAAATGFYYSKAKAENRIKLRKIYGAEIYNDAKEP